jgi:hypothetical protein
MKILFIDHYYPEFIKTFESSLENSHTLSYREIKDILMGEMFGTADFYSKNLKSLGDEAEDVVINFDLMQRRWAGENGVFVGWNLFKKIPYIRGKVDKIFIYKILEAQILKYRPDIIYVQCIGFLDKEFILKIKKHVRLVVGQIASPLPPVGRFGSYDLVISSLPNIVRKLRDANVPSEYLPLSFEHTILEKVSRTERTFPCTFIGGISKNHLERFNLLKKISRKIDFHIFGYGRNEIEKNTEMYKKHHGEVWGREMYEALGKSIITINKHIDIAENFANNMRLFEATGMGALLITDKKNNLNELFEVGKEVVAYEDDEDLIKKIKYYLSHEGERKKIAVAGQLRTLKDHTYRRRMEQLKKILEKYI